MNDLCADIGWRSLNKYGEQLCGDHVDIVEQGDRSTVVVLADGLGSGVKASILSTLTAKIISTMMAEGLPIEECVNTIAETLPVCSQRGIAYSTFTILRVLNNQEAEIIQYDNPEVALFRNGAYCPIPSVQMQIRGKTILRSRIELQENDVFLLMSDGAVHAGLGHSLNFGWDRKDILSFMAPLAAAGYTAKALTSLLLEECNSLYGGKPGDDATVCTLRIRRRAPVNLLIGPPANPDDCPRMMTLFFSKEGKHIVSGGTTSALAADYLHEELVPKLHYPDPDIPPVATIRGVDLVTEGVLTVSRVLAYARDYLGDGTLYGRWSNGADGASKIAVLLFEEATDIHFFVGRAVNPAHQEPGLPIGFNIKMRLVEELADCLKQMGKRIKVSYF
jgi:hypothetical protein